MKRLLVIGSLALTVLLAGCAGMEGSGSSNPDPYTDRSPG